MGSWAASPAWESCSSEAQYTMGMGCRLLSALLLVFVVCEFGAADNRVAGDGSRNIGRPISRTARATSENKLGKRKRTKAKNNGKIIGKPTRSTKNNRRKTKKVDGKNKKKGGKKNKMNKKNTKSKRRREK